MHHHHQEREQLHRLQSKRNNYTRIGRLLTDIGTRVLRGVLDSHHPPVVLQKHINSPTVNSILTKLRAKRVLNTQQWRKLYPSSGAPSSTTFDITLLFLLLRNICGLSRPTTGWDAAPLPTDVSKEADLIRVKRGRNKITAHSTAAELSDADFGTLWAEIEAALIRLGGLKYEPDIQRLKIESIDPENEDFLNVLLQTWEEGDDKKMDVIMEKIDKVVLELNTIKGTSYWSTFKITLIQSIPLMSFSCKDIKTTTSHLHKNVHNIRYFSLVSYSLFSTGDSLPQFCMLPQKPSHPTINRTSEVTEIMSNIQQLKATYPHEITVTYLSGNPGCGKSELARQIGKKYFEDVDESAKSVSTLNASNLENLTLSYIDLARKLQCSEESIASLNAITSQEQKLAQIRGIVSTQLPSYSSWLMIVDNVEDLQLVQSFSLMQAKICNTVKDKS